MDTIQRIPPSQGYIIVDSAKCSGCQACMLICSLVHEGKFNTALARIQVIQDAYKPWPQCIQRKKYRRILIS